LYIANLVAVLEAFISTDRGRSDIVVVDNTSIVICFEKLYLYSIRLIKLLELGVKPKMSASFYNKLLESKYKGRNP